MNPSRSREEEIFETALALPSDQRPAHVKQVCGDDAALRERVETLLQAHEKSKISSDEESRKVAAAAGTIRVSPLPEEKPGEKIGPYKLREKVGEGGCGVVYVADQEQPVRRRVALKVIKLGMDTHAVMARFEAERQALAMMDHPNIAKVLDAGATETGRPYFVMELVRGIKITDYCDQNKLSPHERLKLFIQICQAIQHAHQKGIIHRDIKPSNILVTLHDGVPVPKVIDFGIAKATEGRLTDLTVYTELHQFIGTPAYMSPEQAEMSGLDIDTRSDIYSLGVLLYELLTGRTPFDAKELAQSGLDAMRKTIREKEPLRPSTKLHTLKGEELTTTAQRRGSDAPKLINLLRGDLDWIVMKCLEKDRTRRYETANGLAVDLKRHLSNEPVAARPPSAIYRFQKSFRRNKLAFVAVGAVTAALLLGIIVSAWQAVRATHAKEDALAAQAQEAVQREKAEASEKKAVAAQASEIKLRVQAQAAELAARQRAYASDMNLAMQALAGSNLGRALDLLNRQKPKPGQKDLRGWEWRYLWQQTHSDALFTLCQINGEVCSLAASADGDWLAVGSYHPGGVAVWDLRTRQEVTRLAANEEDVRAAFSPTEPLLAFTGEHSLDSGKWQSTLYLWNTATRQMVAEIPLEDDECAGLAFSQDGRTLVTSTYDEHITLWRVPEGTKLASYSWDQEGMDQGTCFAVTPDLTLAAFASGSPNPQSVCVIDLRTGKKLWQAAAAKVFVTALAFSPDGKTLATAAGFSESDIRLWDVATGKQTGRLAGHGTWVSSIVFWPDGKKLASSSADQTIRIWDVASRKCLDVLRGHRNEVWRLALLPDDKTLVSGAKDGTVCFWDTSVLHPRPADVTLPQKILTCCFAPDSQSILTLNLQGQVTRWSGKDFQQPEPLLEIGTNLYRRREGISRFSDDGRLLAVGSTNGVLQVWDVSRRVLWRQWTNTTREVWPMAFLDDGNQLISAAWHSHQFPEWNLTTGLEMQSWRMPTTYGGAFGVSPDGRLAVAFGYDREVVARNLADASNVKMDLDVLEAGEAGFSPDGKLFAAASDLGYVRVWNTATWRPETTLGGLLNAAHAVAFSPDGQRLAISGGGKEAVKLWSEASWQDVFTLAAPGTGFGGNDNGMAFSPDGNVISWLNMDGDLHLWRAPTWAEIHAAEKAQAENSQK
jgi:eukaryotic-like serine/threonine-protein kinase